MMKFLMVSFFTIVIFANGFGQIPKKAETVNLDDTQIYYEVYGNGEPLFLLHGYTTSSKYWLTYVSEFVDDFEVYLVDLPGHGKSAPFKEKLAIKSIAEDVDALIRYLKLENIKAVGYSFGGEVLFHLALINPDILTSMITIGALGSWDVREHPDIQKILSYDNVNNLPWMPAYQTDKVQIKSILDQLSNLIFSISDDELKSIKTKTLIMLGDDDYTKSFEEVLRLRKHLPDSDLWILPSTGHNAHEGKYKKEFLKISKEFFLDN